ncbi:putative ankyrin repeat protein RF_0381 isoform X2 [Macrobrachium rosenbergii]|uniref:putative ankyrin repeat protein RF_0381 isoform X2 n=1 Tax=Macrobrachium rosenbergii TaxID=79674 RepID=UPI0034D6EF8D
MASVQKPLNRGNLKYFSAWCVLRFYSFVIFTIVHRAFVIAEMGTGNLQAQQFLKLVRKGKFADVRHKLAKVGINKNYVLGYAEKLGLQKGYTGLLWAAYNNDTAMVNFLVAEGSTVSRASASGYTALYHMAEHGNKEVVDMLLGRGANVDAAIYNGYTPILIATEKGFSSIVKALLDKGANPNAESLKTGLTPILLAAEDGSTEIVKLLLDKKADPNTKSETRGFFPLYFAAKMGNVVMVNLLLKAKADVNYQTLNGETALIAATAWDRETIVNILLGASADPNIVDNLKTGALHRAAYYGYVPILKKLVEKKANVSALNVEGRTPLHFCAKGAQTGTLTELLKSCPDDRVRDMNGKTALDLAKNEEEKLIKKRRKTRRTRIILEGLRTFIPKLSGYTNKTCGKKSS